MHRITSHHISSKYTAMPCNATQYNTIHYYTIQYYTKQYDTAPYCTTQRNTIQSTEYRLSHHIALLRATPRHRRLLYLSFYSTQHSASSPLNMHLLAPTLALTLGLGLLLTPVIRTSCSLHDGTRSILSSSSSSSFFIFDTILCHTIPYHTILSLF